MANRISFHEVRVPTTKKCKRCAGRGTGTWGMTYGDCFRCGGGGFELNTDVDATMRQFDDTLARIKAEGEKAKADLEVAVNILHKGNARRSLERARREYKQVLVERQRIIEHYKVRI
jgi:DnaJ-class molecular chaperone